MTVKKLQGHEGNYWIVVDEAWDIDGKYLTSSKTVGKVVIPDWLAYELKSAKTSESLTLLPPRFSEPIIFLPNYGRLDGSLLPSHHIIEIFINRSFCYITGGVQTPF